MRKIFLGLITLVLLFGMATALPNWGPPNGFHNKEIDVDTLTADTITAGVSIGETGAIGVDTTWGAGYDILGTTGDGKVDLGMLTGIFKTPGGINYFKGSSNLMMGPLYIGDTITADVLASNATIRATTLLSTAGDGRIEDDFLVDDDAYVDGTATVNDLVVNTTSTLLGLAKAAGGIDTPADIAANVGGALKAKSFTVNTTTLLTGVATFTAAPVFNAGFVLPAGTDITATSGGSDLDLSAATTGIFKTPGGAVTIGPGAIAVSGSPTIATGKTVAVTDADKLTVGGVIVPQYWDFNVPISSTTVDTNIFIPTSNWQVVAVSEVHSVPGNDGSAVTAIVRKTNSTGAPSAGVAVTAGSFDLKGTANTIQTGTVRSGADAWVTKVNSTERLTLDVTGTLTTLAGGVVTVRLKRI